MIEYIFTTEIDDEVKFIKYVDNLKVNAKSAKRNFISNVYAPLNKRDRIDADKVSLFLIQFYVNETNTLNDFFNDLILFPDEEIFQKFSQLGFSKNILDCFIDFVELENEISRLKSIKGLVILECYILYNIHLFLSTTAYATMINSFFIEVTTNNLKGNIFSKHYSNLLRRISENNKNGQIPKMNLIENAFYNFMNSHNIETDEEFNWEKWILDFLRGNTNNILKNIKFNTFSPYTKRQAYIELFPLLKIIKVRTKINNEKMLSENDYKNKKSAPYDNYDEYKYRTVKKIIG